MSLASLRESEFPAELVPVALSVIALPVLVAPPPAAARLLCPRLELLAVVASIVTFLEILDGGTNDEYDDSVASKGPHCLQKCIALGTIRFVKR